MHTHKHAHTLTLPHHHTHTDTIPASCHNCTDGTYFDSKTKTCANLTQSLCNDMCAESYPGSICQIDSFNPGYLYSCVCPGSDSSDSATTTGKNATIWQFVPTENKCVVYTQSQCDTDCNVLLGDRASAQCGPEKDLSQCVCKSGFEMVDVNDYARICVKA